MNMEQKMALNEPRNISEQRLMLDHICEDEITPSDIKDITMIENRTQ